MAWHGIECPDYLLSRYFGADETEYNRAVGSRWMISAVARAMRPGCQADCVMVLEGEQGLRKSTGLEALFGQAWFADTGISVGDKDSYQALRGKWGYEFGELDAIKGREVTRVKNFVSARTDTYRPSYGRRTRDFPRQTVFCGTTNETEYLVDHTGNRRFWPVRCGAAVDVAALRLDRDQLWAEARHRFDAGEPWHIDTPALRKLCEEAQRQRQVEDPWKAIVETWLANQLARWRGERLRRGDPKPFAGVTTADVMEHALHLGPNHMQRGEETRTGKVLRDLGWMPKQHREVGERVRRYMPPAEEPASAPTIPVEAPKPPSQPSLLHDRWES